MTVEILMVSMICFIIGAKSIRLNQGPDGSRCCTNAHKDVFSEMHTITRTSLIEIVKKHFQSEPLACLIFASS